MRRLFVRPYSLWVLFVLAAAGPVLAQELPAGLDPTYAAASMNPALAGEASAVVRLDLQRFAVAGPGKATHTVQRAVTVLGPEGRDHGQLVIFYDKLRAVKKLEGTIWDAQGKVVRRLKKSDQKDYSAISDVSLYEDSRVRVAELYHDVYPYTVEFAYEVRYEGLVHWPTWFPQEDGVPVEFVRFEIAAPADMAVRYALRGIDQEPQVTAAPGEKVWRWEASMLPERRPEPYGPTLDEQAAAVYTAPGAFEVEGSRGDMGSWQAFGRWYRSLTAGRTLLPAEAQAQVRQLVADAPDEREKVRLLYRHLQATTRYLSIQLGLGGWQPFDAAYVYRRGYGDCKALTNYMQAMLQAVDVPAYPALIQRGMDAPEVLADFPSNQFNHVVLFVPLPADTLWLECTSQTMPFGRLGVDNEDRYALVVGSDGGELVRTPRSAAYENRQLRRARVQLTAGGDAVADVETRYTGSQQDLVREALAQRSGLDRERWLHKTIDIPSFDIVSADFSSVDARDEAITLPVTLKLPRYASRTGTRLFLTPNLMERWGSVPPAAEHRTQPVRFPYAFADVDSVYYELPPGFTVEAAPEPVLLQTPFGCYEAAVVLAPDDRLVYRRRFEITETVLPPAQYEAFRTFLREVAKADRAQVVLVQGGK